MNRCVKCKIEVLDDSAICPLCRNALERDENVTGENRSVMYPKPHQSFKKLRFAIRITVFSAILAEAVAVLVNYLTFNGFWWSQLSGAALLFGCFSLIFCTSKNRSLQRKIVTELIVGEVIMIIVDSLLDFARWSLHYGFPAFIVGVDIAMLVLMIINYTVWIEYMYSIIWILVDSLICLGLCFLFGDTFPLYPIIAAGVTAFFLAGIIVVGDKKAESELHRRFHI